LGENWEDILGIVDQYERATAAVLIVLVVPFVAYRLREMRRNRARRAMPGPIFRNGNRHKLLPQSFQPGLPDSHRAFFDA